MAMAPATYSLTPVHPHVGVEVVEVDLSVPLRRRHVPGDFRRVPRVVGPGLPRPGPHRLAGRLQRALRSPRGDGQEPGELRRLPEGDRRHLERRSGGALIPPRRPAHDPPLRQPALAQRQLLQAGPDPRLLPIGARGPAGRRGDRVRQAYDRLDNATRRRTDGLVDVHDFEYSRSLVAPGLLTAEQRAQVPAVRQALVRTNPVNGRKAFSSGRTCARSWAC